MKKSPALLCILDGVGIAPDSDGNAVTRAHTPTLDALMAKHSNAEIRTDGRFVGLPDGQMGNSEVGHITIGAGRVIKQSLSRITDDLKDNLFTAQHGYQDFIADITDTTRAIHIVGLLSDGGVHSHGDHALEIARLLNEVGRAKNIPIFIHAISDGRDAEQKSALAYFQWFADKIEPLEHVHLASVIGRFYAMDRDQRWERIEKAWTLFTTLKGKRFNTVSDIFESSYANNIFDEFLEPATLSLDKNLDARIQDSDAVLTFNFRADRMRQIIRCFLGLGVGFEHKVLKLDTIASMTDYDTKFNAYGIHVIYPQERHAQTLGEVVAHAGLSQLRIAETEKYPHVTYYLNAGREAPFEGESRILVNSPKDVKFYDLKPQMSLPEVTEKLVNDIENDTHDFIALNIANGDMVGHCGDMDAAIKAMEYVDTALNTILKALKNVGGQALIIADHGNIEEMVRNGKPCTTHTTNPVPNIYVDYREGAKSSVTLKNGALADVAPTLLDMLGLDKPEQMSGQSLLEK